MPSCAAVGCENRDEARQRKEGVTFHRFPHREPERLKRWILNMRRKNWTPSKTSLLCSAHFLDKYFDRTGQTVRLRSNAEPTEFVFPAHLQKKSSRRKQLAPRRTLDASHETVESLQTRTLDESHQSLQTVSAHTVVPPIPQQLHAVNVCDHSYFLESPMKLKHKLDRAVAELEACKKKLKMEQQRTRRLKQKVFNLNSVIDSLRNQNLESTNCDGVLESFMELLNTQTEDTPSHTQETSTHLP